MRVAIAVVACVAALPLTACFEGPKRETPGWLDLADLQDLQDLQVLRDLRERTFQSS
jgi:hypothetical protein